MESARETVLKNVIQESNSKQNEPHVAGCRSKMGYLLTKISWSWNEKDNRKEYENFYSLANKIKVGFNLAYLIM